MAELTSHADGMDFSYVKDPDVRRALRAMHQQMSETMTRQQMEIDALLEMIMDKHLGSLGEFKRHLIRLQQNHARGERIHEAVNAASQRPAAPPSV